MKESCIICKYCAGFICSYLFDKKTVDIKYDFRFSSIGVPYREEKQNELMFKCFEGGAYFPYLVCIHIRYVITPNMANLHFSQLEDCITTLIYIIFIWL